MTNANKKKNKQKYDSVLCQIEQLQNKFAIVQFVS